MKALIIDDDPGFTGLLGQVLPYPAYDDVLIATNSQEALPLLVAPLPDLILCDLHMPRGDGLLLVDQLAHLDFRGTLVFLSGESRERIQAAEAHARARGLRVIGSLQKPFELAELDALLAGEARP